MIQQDLLIETIEKIDKSGLPYMLTGAIAVDFYGKPRLTHDIDILIEISSESAKKFCGLFKDNFYADEKAVENAIFEKSMFNFIHNKTGLKLDFWLIDKERGTRGQISTFNK